MKKLLFSGIAILLLSACSAGNHIVKSARDEYQINQSIGVDSTIIKTYFPYKIQLDAEMNKVIGFAAVDLTKESKLPESVLGNFFADAVAHQVEKILPNIDLVFPTTKGGLRNDIAKGAITASNIFELMPFENQLVLLELKGEALKSMLQWIAASNGQPISGLKMQIKDGKPDMILINGKALDPNKNYLIVTSDYLANGGDDSTGLSNPVSRRNIGLLVRDALMNEVIEAQAAGKQITAKLDGRITKN